MQQLANALQAAGYRSSEQLRAERDRAIAALVKARKSKRRGAKQLKARVLALVAALKVPAPIVTLLVLVMMPSLALAHPGHGHGPDMNAGGAIVLVGVTLGLAAHAWANWGPRRRLVASVEGGGAMAGGSIEPEPEPEPEPTLDAQARSAILADGPNGVANQHAFLCHDDDGSMCRDGCDNRANQERYRVLCRVADALAISGKPWAGNAIPRPYYTVRIPFVTLDRATVWHPTEPSGPFSTLTRGAHKTVADARAWADTKLGSNPYSVVFVAFDLTTGKDTLTTVYTTEGK